ncbi:MAG: hypothetical protein COU81_02545 [Candidatus Portnoybacteria bacterium CG10_big_fil_rev_8_21_14_0_10_36_7]|uniref:Carbonic anhydrase n=1 Tax=Candidatus Portnoybacteria bacterium CG10_big_fil_rev_8_21_14_0_10_36_7 TaxID=1974812 RepID=A0A2M8KDV8_9BACT|nr:MAG: hypothetical protein COU81_02545 [Candidatus Portnoybacteria bacterium CG10_big_fil_rev_8_21_14_0_10_36_7]
MAQYQFKNIHEAETAILHCLDPRFTKAHKTFLEAELGLEDFDVYVLPCEGKNILEDEFGQTLTDKIGKVSAGLHKTKKLILVSHRDCGAYGSSKAFASRE